MKSVTFDVIKGDSVLDKGDGRRSHTGGLVTEKSDDAKLKPVTFYILIGDGFC